MLGEPSGDRSSAEVDHRIRPREVPWIEDSQIRIPVHLVGEFRGFAHQQSDEMTRSGEQGSDLASDHSAAAGDEDVFALLPRQQRRVRGFEEIDVHEHPLAAGVESGFKVVGEAPVDDVEALRSHGEFDVVVDLRPAGDRGELVRVLPLAQRPLLQLIDEGEPRRPLRMHRAERPPHKSVGTGNARLHLRHRARRDRRVALFDDLLRPVRREAGQRSWPSMPVECGLRTERNFRCRLKDGHGIPPTSNDATGF